MYCADELNCHWKEPHQVPWQQQQQHELSTLPMERPALTENLIRFAQNCNAKC